MKKMAFNRQKGFTIVELMIYMGLLGILVAILSQIFSSIIGVQLESEAMSTVSQDGRYILSRLIYDINRAKDIIEPADIGSTSNQLQIVINENGNDVVYTYSLAEGNLLINNNHGSNQLNSNDTILSNLNFIRLGNSGGKNNIRVNFNVTSKIIKQSGTETDSFQTVVGIR